MRNLIKFISLYNYSITFLLLVLFSSYFLINENFVLKTKYLNSSNYIIGSVFSFQSSLKNYFTLKEKNLLLQNENKLLKEKIINTSTNSSYDSINSLGLIDAAVINIDKKGRKISLSIKAKEIEEEKKAMAEYGSSDSGASLGDILGAALAKKDSSSS